MKKHLPLVCIMAACITFAVTCKKEEAPKDEGQAVEEAAKPLIITPISAAPQQKPAVFDHNAHKKWAAAQGKNCKTCHHKGKLNEKCSTKGCHFGPGAEQLVHKKCYGECHLSAARAPKQGQCAACHRQ